ncbi:MAG: FtsX-like permease family protein, partial [Candidatus Hydrogenedentes bacterium]|nr:FtsX-like permease family protein [Candidatus Hydrogenedentota bacterium]
MFYVGSGYRTSIGGLTRLIIPLIIAATIILNTMLGSVYERKSEIAVYNAIGLNPTHIGLFFLAEALVYSVIGSVGGYLAGQTLAIVLTQSQIITGLNLNFSSLSVAYVILVTIAIVLLSTLYPAVVATRAAIPSGKRRWSMPPHHDGRMEAVFPFVYQPSLAAGVMAYLVEYFSRFTEASMGDLLASVQSKTKGQDAAGKDTYTLSYNVALTPFDLGVTQKVTFHAAYDEVVKSYRVSMRINRTSGQDSNWVTTNRPFLERLRRYLMNWRNMDAAEHKLYGQRAAESFLPGEK